MRLEHSFTVPVPVEKAWEVLLDLPRIAPCMPGATLTGVEGDTFTGTVKVKLGPIVLTYQGKGRFVEHDAAAHRAVIEATGKDTRSAGTAAATVIAALAGEGDTTRVDVSTELTVTGRPAQFGRGMIADVGGKLIGQFADCLADTLTSTPAEPQAPPAVTPAEQSAAVEPTSAEQSAAPVGSAEAEQSAEQSAAPVGSAEAEPIDLLKLTGSSATARRLAGYALGAVLLATLTWVTVRWLRR